MLRIKEGIDLKELEKFGFKPKYDEDTGKLVEMYRICGDIKGTTITMAENFNSDRKYKNFWNVFSHSRELTDHGYVKLIDQDYEILYDLIKADMVERI